MFVLSVNGQIKYKQKQVDVPFVENNFDDADSVQCVNLRGELFYPLG